MESGLPLLHCLLQHTLRGICSVPSSSSSSSTTCSSSSKWVYAVFWRVVPRNFPPPRWEFGGTSLDRSKGNKRNWILVWEDGFCDFNECQQGTDGIGCLSERFAADVFFKMSHEVYNFGEGLLGKVAAENSHRWVYSDTENGCEPTIYIGSWNASIDHQPRAWEYQFNAGIQTIAIIAVREGLVQLGSFNKIPEDLNIVLNIQRKFSYLQTIPGVFAIQRPSQYLSIQQHPSSSSSCIAKTNNFHMMMENNEVSLYNMSQQVERSNYFSMIAINMGRNNNGPQGTQLGTSLPLQPIWSAPPSLPNMSCSLGALLTKFPSEIPSYNNHHLTATQVHGTNRINNVGQRVKVEDCGFHVDDDHHDDDQKGKEKEGYVAIK